MRQPGGPLSLAGMETQAPAGRSIHANGIDIHYIEAGAGPPLILLHGGIVSTNPVWAGHPFAYVSSMDALAAQFRVIAPDARGYGRTVHPGGAIPYTLLADDVAALIAALELDRPAVCGFSDGAMTATVVAIRHPRSVGSLVNHSGYDLLNPDAPTHAMMRQMLGGSPDAKAADPEAAERMFGSSDEMRMTFALMQADHDGSQGDGYWQTLIAETFDRLTQPAGYTFDDLGAVEVPALVLTGDRDQFCTVEEALVAYRALPQGQLAVLPDHGHLITPAAIRATTEFLGRFRR
jgi:pimeloyl-ACP methyl ester carboxylesterase